MHHHHISRVVFGLANILWTPLESVRNIRHTVAYLVGLSGKGAFSVVRVRDLVADLAREALALKGAMGSGIADAEVDGALVEVDGAMVTRPRLRQGRVPIAGVLYYAF